VGFLIFCQLIILTPSIGVSHRKNTDRTSGRCESGLPAHIVHMCPHAGSCFNWDMPLSSYDGCYWNYLT
jgi:hypothetical protein